MAASVRFYVASTEPGKHWRVSSYKPQGRPGYVSATEGEVTDEGRSFSYVLLQARSRRVMVKGNMTARNINRAVVQLANEMEDAGEVVKSEPWEQAT